MVAVVGIDAQLIDDLKVVLGPVPEVDQHVMERRAVLALEITVFSQGFGGLKDIGIDHLVAQPGEFRIGEAYAVQRLELLAEILLQRDFIANIRAVAVLELLKLADQLLLDVTFFLSHPLFLLILYGSTRSNLPNHPVCQLSHPNSTKNSRLRDSLLITSKIHPQITPTSTGRRH